MREFPTSGRLACANLEDPRAWPPSRLRALAVVSILAALALPLGLAGCVAPEETQDPTDPRPVHFAPGGDAGPDRLSARVPRYALGEDRTTLDIEIVGSPDARLEIGSLFRIVNDDTVARRIVLRAPSIDASTGIREYRIDVPGAGAPALDLLSNEPSLTTTLLPASALDARVTLALAPGATRALSVSALALDVIRS